MNNPTRRDIVRLFSLLGVGHAAQQLFSPAQLLAQAQATAGDYRALVCVTLDGGCDSNNLVVPLQADQYASYKAARPDLAIPQASLLPIMTGTGEAYGINPALPSIASLYDSGKCAIIANTGPLKQPLTVQAYNSTPAAVPTNLMNHELQRVQWGTCYTDTSAAAATHTGWGGRMADALQAYSSGSYPIITSLANGLEESFCYGVTAYPAFLSPGATAFADSPYRSLQAFAKMSSGSTLISAANDGMRAAYQQDLALRSALAGSSPLKTQFPSSTLGAQLQEVATLMAARGSLGLQRQVFLVQQGGFDSHQFQLNNDATPLAELDAAISAFQAALEELGLSKQVLMFTTTDFNRTLKENSSLGTEHAWGGHQFVIGSAIKAADLIGTFPQLTLNGPDDYYQGWGSWIPTTSVDQYGATLASWMGVPDSALDGLFPNLRNFTTRKLRFV